MVKIGMLIADRYEILEKTGTGGMSVVYRAKDHKLNRIVAVKVLKQEFSDNANFVSKFRVEAQAAAGLMHPNIVNVYDVGEEKGMHYIVMEYVDGITLKKYIEMKSRLTVKEAISIAIQVSMGLQAAHQHHVIHRDIKPQNIMIGKDGKVKVTDFGIAKAATSNTITSNVMGSVHYTSPEQARGGYSDERSDIYSLGITMFEMLTGRVPFNGETTVAIAIKHIQQPMPSPREFVPDIPRSVEQIVLKCCEKSPDRRYQNMGELIADLKQALIHPEDDFVKVINPDEESATRMAEPAAQSEIRRRSGTGSTGRLHTMDRYVDQYGSYADRQAAGGRQGTGNKSSVSSLSSGGQDGAYNGVRHETQGSHGSPSHGTGTVASGRNGYEEGYYPPANMDTGYRDGQSGRAGYSTESADAGYDGRGDGFHYGSRDENSRYRDADDYSYQDNGGELSYRQNTQDRPQDDVYRDDLYGMDANDSGDSYGSRSYGDSGADRDGYDAYDYRDSADGYVNSGRGSGSRSYSSSGQYSSSDKYRSSGRHSSSGKYSSSVRENGSSRSSYGKSGKRTKERIDEPLRRNPNSRRSSYDSSYDEYDSRYDTRREHRITAIVVIIAVIVGILIIVFAAYRLDVLPLLSGNGATESSTAENTQGVTLPAMVGENAETLKTTLNSLGLIPEVTYEESDQYDSEIVMGAALSDGTTVNQGDVVEVGTNIVLTVSAGQSGIEIPDVTGMTRAEAAATLRRSGFDSINWAEGVSNDVEKGQVISQDPAAGTVAPAESTLTVTISTGMDTSEQIQVPDVTGLSLAEATETLTDNNLLVGTTSETETSDPNKVGLVISQSVEADTFVDAQTSVNLTIGKAVEQKPTTYYYNTDIQAPTAEEAPDYVPGTAVYVVFMAADGQTLLNSTYTSFPIPTGFTGLSSSSGTIQMSFPSAAAENGQRVITRNVTFTAED